MNAYTILQNDRWKVANNFLAECWRRAETVGLDGVRPRAIEVWRDVIYSPYHFYIKDIRFELRAVGDSFGRRLKIVFAESVNTILVNTTVMKGGVDGAACMDDVVSRVNGLVLDDESFLPELRIVKIHDFCGDVLDMDRWFAKKGRRIAQRIKMACFKDV